MNDSDRRDKLRGARGGMVFENPLRRPSRLPATVCLLALTWASPLAQAPDPDAVPATRAEAIEAEQARKATHLEPYTVNTAERIMNRIESAVGAGGVRWHPFFENAYSGGGFTVGAGYRKFVSSYNSVDLRGSITFKGYKRIEAEFLAPQMFERRGSLSVIGGWREATQVGFYGVGIGSSADDRVNYGFDQPYASASLRVFPFHRRFVVAGELELSQWQQDPGSGSAPSVEEVYAPGSLPGLGASPTYLRTAATAGFDWRPAADYARRGGYYAVTVTDFADRDEAFGFSQVDYTAIQHVPILRETWVLSLRGEVVTTHTKGSQEIPFFMLPALGGGSNLRGFDAWRFRDRHSLLLSADWRVMANRFMDVALFADAGKVVPSRSDFDLKRLKSNVGIGVRFHGPISTPIRIDVAKANEGFQVVFASKAVF